jgi:hypothetical protein
MPNTKASATKKLDPSEKEIRLALLDLLGQNSGPEVRVQEELRLERGGARIDVAVIGASLVGYEIKSDADTFTRFSNQIHAYNRIFDSIHLVCGARHLAAARLIIPSWWGLSVATRDNDGSVRIAVEREASPNLRQDSFSLASMLWREEALAMIENDSVRLPKQSSSHVIWEHIASSFPLEAIKSAVSSTLLNRTITVG